jgi:hypothetical protein
MERDGEGWRGMERNEKGMERGAYRCVEDNVVAIKRRLGLEPCSILIHEPET